ncbi:aminoacyl-tRNA hydrolase [Desulfuribacillus alkaliarsenatis]|uniref:Peptidyl-tRNA hydrolase n=1 Tax=Desulfuribacillus alkaliarsenatis TaxID=766136 RepID=A0A1E5FYU9_9FIRM|nr:aminoacyl-tRNA hydrolase [Desulfuribacillus alkaliarsenatis]OEF95755.1 aminoacyl-tRNA hydrolase [Desulfuribacillus alkaliarsenatis]
MKLIVGLGNPGQQYKDTRHNVGFMLVDELANELGIKVEQSKFKGLVGEGRLEGGKVALLKPMTYMNLSGESVRAAMDWYKLDEQDILVVYDDLDLEVGKLRFRPKGGAGGHNGIKSLTAHLGTEQYSRLKIGIGRPVHGDVVNHVLTKFSSEERDIIDEKISYGIKGIKEFIKGSDILEVMNQYN